MNSNKSDLESSTKAKLESEKASKKYPEKPKMKSDKMFKAFFGRKGNEKFLESFLTAVLGEPTKIQRVVHDSSLEQLSEKVKYGILDLDVQRDNGEIINIEIQLRNLHNIEPRTTFYASKKIAEQLAPGADYAEIKNVIVVAILDYNFLAISEYLNKTITVLEKHREIEINNEIQRIYIELPKFRESHPDMGTLLNQWLAIIDGEDKELVDMAKKNNKIIEEADEMYNVLTGDANLRRLEEVKIFEEMDKKAALRLAKEEGRTEGIEEGREEGKEEGKKEGREEGGKEKQIEIAKELLKINMSIEQIVQVTKLTKEEVEDLKK